MAASSLIFVHAMEKKATNMPMMGAVPLSAVGPASDGVRVTPIGNPTWSPVDFHLFSAPIGTGASGYEEFLETLLALLPPPNHVFHPDLGVGPGAPHAPPYDSELANSVANLGFREGTRFNLTEEFSNGAGVYLVWMNVPSPGTTGSSPDFASGAIIPNSLFPIHVTLRNLHSGKVFSGVQEFLVPKLDGSLNPPFAVDGHSHFPVFIADNADFGPENEQRRGSYVYQITLIDQLGNGWRIEGHFVIAP
jgi:hypothetical protein